VITLYEYQSYECLSVLLSPVSSLLKANIFLASLFSVPWRFPLTRKRKEETKNKQTEYFAYHLDRKPQLSKYSLILISWALERQRWLLLSSSSIVLLMTVSMYNCGYHFLNCVSLMTKIKIARGIELKDGYKWWWIHTKTTCRNWISLHPENLGEQRLPKRWYPTTWPHHYTVSQPRR
jgi:hypothetical protein